ncbi:MULTISPECIES: helix-turn-helix transcriptional regulator [unclassified Streptomyces]|uniref:helix-turn-helix transcriptional regulator n=1 Tax=unclassified Streptomyces TaxID=2593676 RepID=UPI00378C1C09
MEPTHTEEQETDELARSVYLHCLVSGLYDPEGLRRDLGLTAAQMDRALQSLLRLRLLRADSDHGWLLLPASPQSAASDLMDPWQQEIDERRRRMIDVSDRLRDFAATYADYLHGHMPVGSSIPVDTAEDLSTRLKEAIGRCRSELLIMRPVDQSAAEAGDVAPDVESAALEGLDPAVEVRVLTQHTVKSSPAARALLQPLHGSRVTIRTAATLPARLLVFDRESALLHHSPESATQATLVTDTRIVGFLSALHEKVWQSSTEFHPGRTGTARLDASDVQTSILELLTAGHSDDAVARMLSISVRTCRRHVADLLSQLGCSTRFEAGAEAVRRGLVARS